MSQADGHKCDQGRARWWGTDSYYLENNCCKLVENYLENNCYAAQLFLTLIMMKIVTRSFMMIKIDRNIYHKF